MEELCTKGLITQAHTKTRVKVEHPLHVDGSQLSIPLDLARDTDARMETDGISERKKNSLQVKSQNKKTLFYIYTKSRGTLNWLAGTRLALLPSP